MRYSVTSDSYLTRQKPKNAEVSKLIQIKTHLY